jgi:predicted MFS family arabinose efflux permease
MVFASTYEVLLVGRALVGVSVGIGLAVCVNTFCLQLTILSHVWSGTV